MSDHSQKSFAATTEGTSYINSVNSSSTMYVSSSGAPLNNVVTPRNPPAGMSVSFYGQAEDSNGSNTDFLFSVGIPEGFVFDSCSCDSANNTVTCNLSTDGEAGASTEYLSVQMAENYSNETWEVNIAVQEDNNSEKKWNWKFTKKNPMPM